MEFTKPLPSVTKPGQKQGKVKVKAARRRGKSWSRLEKRKPHPGIGQSMCGDGDGASPGLGSILPSISSPGHRKLRCVLLRVDTRSRSCRGIAVPPSVVVLAPRPLSKRLPVHRLRLHAPSFCGLLSVASSGASVGIEGWHSASAIMASKVEGAVLGYITEQNRPLNAQMVSDALAKHGIKKQAVQKVMDTLAANGKISFKDFGKQRVCLANQTLFDIPDMDELDAMKKQNDQLQADVAAIRSHVGELESGVKSTESNLTLDAIREKTQQLNSEIEVLESKVVSMREGSVLVTPEERLEVKGSYDHKLGMWRRRKKIYQELWGMITESMTENLKDLKEEIGVETDEDAGCNIVDYSNLGVKKQKTGF